MRRAAFPVLLLAWAAGALNFLSLGDHGLWLPDEGREAEIAREYWTAEDWTVPRMNGGRWLEKPPLYHWAAAGLFRAFGGPSPFLARLPSALAAVAVGLLAWWLARRFNRPALGPWAAFMAWTSAELVNAGHLAMVDALFAAFVVAATACFAAAFATSPPDSPDRWAPLWNVLGALAMGLAFLTKFHLGVALVGATILAWMLLARSLAPLKALASPLPVLVLAAVLAAWPTVLHRREAKVDAGHADIARMAGQSDAPPTRMALEAVAEILWGQLFHRSTGNRYGHAQGPLFYLPHLFLFAAPWSLALLAALPWGWRRAREGDGLARLCVAWLLGNLILLSVPKCKRVIYLLPCVPPAALLVAAWGEDLLARWQGTPRLRRAALGLGLLLIALSAAFPWAASRIGATGTWPWTAVLLAFPVASALAALRGRLAAAGFLLAAWLPGLGLAVSQTVVPALDRVESFVPLATQIRHLESELGPRSLLSFRLSENLQGGFCFALGRRLEDFHDPALFKERLGWGDRLAFMSETSYAELAEDPAVARLTRKVGAGQVSGIPFVILATAP